jgi:GT2 family glycosyltransferase
MAAEFPLVSLVAIIRNGGKRFEAPLQSFATQRLPTPHEVVVVDNASTDETPRLVERAAKEWPHIRLVREEELGPGAARHAGAKASKGELLVFVDGDMILGEDFVAEHVAAHSGDAEECVVGAIVSRPGRHPFERMLAYIYDGPRSTIATRPLAYSDCWGGNLSIPHALYFRLGGFHDVYGGLGSDAHLAQRMADNSVPLRYAPRAVAAHVMHDRFGPRLRRVYLKGIAVGIHKSKKEEVARSTTALGPAGKWPLATEWACWLLATLIEPFDRGSGVPIKPLCFLYDLGLRAAMRRGEEDFERGRTS